MSTAMDPYQILGVPPTATRQQIKHAYHSLAKRLHPDQNPEANQAEQFGRVAFAYSLLNDPERRAKYDRDGTIDQAVFDVRNEMVTCIASFFEMIMQSLDKPLRQTDILGLMRRKAQELLSAADAANRDIGNTLTEISALQELIIKDTDDNIIANVLRSKTAKLKEAYQHNQRVIEVQEHVLAELAMYKTLQQFMAGPLVNTYVTTSSSSSNFSWATF